MMKISQYLHKDDAFTMLLETQFNYILISITLKIRSEETRQK